MPIDGSASEQVPWRRGKHSRVANGRRRLAFKVRKEPVRYPSPVRVRYGLTKPRKHERNKGYYAVKFAVTRNNKWLIILHCSVYH